MKPIFKGICLSLVLVLSACRAEVSDYDIVWSTPSEDASGSIPIGNGEVGANVWVEPGGDLVFYISRTDSWSETGELYKLGRIRVSFTPSIVSGDDFCQRLDLADGCIRVHGAGTDLKFWIDSEQPVIRIAGKSKKGISVSAKAEVWRDHEARITPEEAESCFRSISGFPEDMVFNRYADEILDSEDAVVVRHHNTCSSYDATLDLQGIEIENRAAYDPFKDRCFGFRMAGKGLGKTSELELSSDGAVKEIDICIATHSGIFASPDDWSAEVDRIASEAPASSESFKRTAGYWNNYWKKSYIYVETPDGETGRKINSAYILQSWMQACAGRGNYPIKFNGSIFTVDPKFTDPELDGDPDFRRWGGDYWWQNTRLPYHPMLKSGDFDMMMPLFEHYFHNLPMMKANARALAGAEGALSPETATVFGTFCCNDYGWDREDCTDSLPKNNFIKRHWSSSLELVSLMLDYYDYTGDTQFVQKRIIPFAKEALLFYDTAFGRDGEGKLMITPTQSLETYWYNIVNDTPTLAGLHDVLHRLQALPVAFGDQQDRLLWQRLADELPGLPVETVDGVEVFGPAWSYDPERCNVENPELYPVFPYHLCNVSTGNLQTGRNSYERRKDDQDFGWSQDGQEAARLGLVDEARAELLKRIGNGNPAFRFPAIWGPNFDWTPDQDHGSNLLTTLQDMVLQTYDGVDYILPAFPEDWGVKFKLYSFGGKCVKYRKHMPATAGTLKPSKEIAGVWECTVGTPEAIVPTSVRSFQIKETECNVASCPVQVRGSVQGDTAVFCIPVGLDENFYGLGLQMSTYRLNGLKKRLRVNADPATDEGDSHAPVPFFLSTAGYGIFVDTERYASFDFSQPGKVTIYVPRSGGASLKIFAGPTMKEALARYNMYSGGGCNPPEWGLGFWYRVERDFTDKEVLSMAAEFREKDFPCSVIGLEPGWQTETYSCSYVWSDRFPDPKAFVESMTAMGFKVNVWEHAFIHPTSPIHEAMKPYSGDHLVWEGLVPDFTLPEARRIFSDYMADITTRIGISGFKADECDGSDFTGGWSFPMDARFPGGADGEQMHSMFGLRYQDVLLETAAKAGIDENYGLVRNSGSFAAPYPFVLYSDLYDHRTFINSVAQSSFSGLLWTPEVRQAANPEELLLRMQSTVLSPLAMVNAWYLKYQPWKQVDRDLNNEGKFMPGWKDLEAKCRDLAKLREELIPEIQGAFAVYSQTGVPPFRALVIDWPDDPSVADINGQYMIGDHLMAAPPAYGEDEIEVYFPEPGSEWESYDGSATYKGGTTIILPVTSDMLYLFRKL